jgi:amino acid transporter
MDVGLPELLIIFLVIGLLGLIPTILGIARAARNNDTGWLVGIILGWVTLGVGWIVAIVYLVAVDGPRSRGAGSYTPTPTPPPPGGQPAGWYGDPAGRADQRYWDGFRWTEHVMRGGLQGIDPL